MTTLSEPETLALIDNSDRRDAKRLLRVVESARHSELSRKNFFADFYAEVLPGRDLKVAAC